MDEEEMHVTRTVGNDPATAKYLGNMRDYEDELSNLKGKFEKNRRRAIYVLGITIVLFVLFLLVAHYNGTMGLLLLATDVAFVFAFVFVLGPKQDAIRRQTSFIRGAISVIAGETLREGIERFERERKEHK